MRKPTAIYAIYEVRHYGLKRMVKKWAHIYL